MAEDCLFCNIVSEEAPAHTVWEDDDYLAFLSIFPNTKGTTVVIPKEHHESYAFTVPESVLLGLTKAAKEVGRRLDKTFEDAGRTGMVYEGFGVNHLHAKLFPMHGTESDEWKKQTSDIKTYYDEYPGYISSHDAERVSDEELEHVAEQIRTS